MMNKKKEDEIDGLIVDLCNNARHLKENRASLVPVAMMLSKDKGIIPCMLPFRNDEEKSALYYGLGTGMKKYKASRVILINDVAMKMYDKPAEKISELEKPLTYPESMRQDGIFLQDVDLATGRVDGYFMRYENKKDAPRFYYELKHLNKGAVSMGGLLLNQIKDGYETGFSKMDFIEVNPKTGKPREPQSPDSTHVNKGRPQWKMPGFDNSGIPGIPGLGG
jgi:hypothetical protein